MRRLTFLLRPQWLALIVVVIAFAYLCFTVLAPWQLGKNTETSRQNAQITQSLKADPVPVTSLLPQQDSTAPDEQWRLVTATGRYLPEAQVKAATFDKRGGAISPTPDEIEANPRARSAKLRVAIRTAAPFRAADPSIFGLPKLPEIRLPVER